MTETEIKQITDYMADEENMKKFTMLELAKLNLYMQEYLEKVEPIVKKAMTRDTNSKFLFKV